MESLVRSSNRQMQSHLTAHTLDPRDYLLLAKTHTPRLYKHTSSLIHNHTHSKFKSNKSPQQFNFFIFLIQWPEEESHSPEAALQRKPPLLVAAKPAFNSPSVVSLVFSKPASTLSVSVLVPLFISPPFSNISLLRYLFN